MGTHRRFITYAALGASIVLLGGCGMLAQVTGADAPTPAPASTTTEVSDGGGTTIPSADAPTSRAAEPSGSTSAPAQTTAPARTPATSTAQAPPATSAAPRSPAPAVNASEEIQKGVDRLNSQPGSPHPFLPETMDTSTYDPNAPLSYVVIFDVINSDNGSSQIMLFSYGKHLGTTTKVPQPLWVEVERLSDSSIKVTYLDEALVWDGVRQGPDFVSTYTWDGKKVVMKGEVPYE